MYKHKFKITNNLQIIYINKNVRLPKINYNLNYNF